MHLFCENQYVSLSFVKLIYGPETWFYFKPDPPTRKATVCPNSKYGDHKFFFQRAKRMIVIQISLASNRNGKPISQSTTIIIWDTFVSFEKIYVHLYTFNDTITTTKV